MMITKAQLKKIKIKIPPYLRVIYYLSSMRFICCGPLKDRSWCILFVTYAQKLMPINLFIRGLGIHLKVPGETSAKVKTEKPWVFGFFLSPLNAAKNSSPGVLVLIEAFRQSPGWQNSGIFFKSHLKLGLLIF